MIERSPFRRGKCVCVYVCVCFCLPECEHGSVVASQSFMLVIVSVFNVYSCRDSLRHPLSCAVVFPMRI